MSEAARWNLAGTPVSRRQEDNGPATCCSVVAGIANGCEALDGNGEPIRFVTAGQGNPDPAVGN